VAPVVMEAVDDDDETADVFQAQCVGADDDAPVHARYRGKSDIVTRLDPGSQVTVIASKKNWRRITYGANNAPGWVVATYLDECPERPQPGPQPQPQPTGSDQSTTITPSRITTTAQLRALPLLQPKQYRVHLIDVGTGLSILLQGHDFNMLFDAGSGDDKRVISQGGNPNRLIAYLWAALGPSGPANCLPEGEPADTAQDRPPIRIHHAVLSHPHDDHGSLLADVLYCYRVDHVWDVGVVNDAVFYKGVIQKVAAESGATYHTAVEVPASRSLKFTSGAVTIPAAVTWERFTEGQQQDLGTGAARFTILHANAGTFGDFNQNSIVMRVDLGGTSLLLTGDAESGGRELPSAPVGDVEQHLLTEHTHLLDVDILQVGHHGSKTSSRQEFLDAVSPRWALIGAGPKKYKSVTLPDPEIEQALAAMGATILDTNIDEKTTCPVADRIGDDDGQRPGGCGSHLLTIE
jgi:competence protein ComEC